MACKLRVAGEEFDVDRFLTQTGARHNRSFRRGEQVRNTQRTYPWSGFQVEVSNGEFEEYDKQVQDALAFLADDTNKEWLKAAAQVPDLERVLDFGIRLEDVAVQCDRIPAALARAAGEFEIDILISHYPVE